MGGRERTPALHDFQARAMLFQATALSTLLALPSDPQPAPPPAPRDDAALEAWGELIPPGAMALVWARSLDELEAELGQMAELAGEEAPSMDELLGFLEFMLGLDPTWIDRDAAIGLALAAPQGESEDPGLILLLPMEDASRARNRLSTPEGAARPRWSGDWLGLPMAERYRAPVSASPLLERALESDLGLVVDLEPLMEAMGEEILAAAEEGVSQRQAELLAGMPAGEENEAYLAGLDAGADMTRMFLESARGLALFVDLEGGALRLHGELELREDSSWASAPAVGATNLAGLASALGSGSALSLVGALDADWIEEHLNAFSERFGELMPAEDAEGMQEYVRSMQELYGGPGHGFALRADMGPDGLELLWLADAPTRGQREGRLRRFLSSQLGEDGGLALAPPQRSQVQGIPFTTWSLAFDVAGGAERLSEFAHDCLQILPSVAVAPVDLDAAAVDAAEADGFRLTDQQVGAVGGQGCAGVAAGGVFESGQGLHDSVFLTIGTQVDQLAENARVVDEGSLSADDLGGLLLPATVGSPAQVGAHTGDQELVAG